MTTHAVPSSRWATAAFPDAGDSLPAELTALGAHVRLCNGSRGRWFDVHCAAEAAHSFIAPRFITTLAAAALVLGISALML